MGELGLVFGTIDLKVADNGDHVFLEINPQGQFLYIEILTGLPISNALADFLAYD
jgi:glutathione synthase/RimK-type ligase-like ATP-grasp enzyme